MRPAAEPQPAAVVRCGTPLRCPLCGGERFFTHDYALRSREDELLKQPWATSEARVHVCASCAHMLWFADAGP